MPYDRRKVDLEDFMSDNVHNNYDMHMTFINAFESSPVHCLKLRPSGNLRRPGKAGTDAILVAVEQM